MRLRPLFFATLLAFAAWSAHAQDQAPPDADAARDRFEAGLADNCPQKQLQLLSARNLRDGLDSYVESLPPDLHDLCKRPRPTAARTPTPARPASNMADILAADQTGHMRRPGNLSAAAHSCAAPTRGTATTRGKVQSRPARLA